MSRPFLAGATGNPINLQRRIALQSTRGVPPSEGLQASEVLDISGSVSDGDTVTIGTRVYEFDTDASVSGSNVLVDVSGGATAPDAVTALVAAINADTSAVVYAADGAGDTVVVFAKAAGTAGNSIALAEDGANLAWTASATNLSGGTDTSYVDFRSDGGPIIREASEIVRKDIAPGGAPRANLTGKLNISGGPFDLGDVDPANRGQLRMLANAFGRYTYSNQTTYHRWYFGLDGATVAPEFLALHDDDDVIPRTRWIDLLLGGLNVQAGPNQNLAIGFPMVCGEYDFHGQVAQIAGAEGATLPIVKRTSEYNWDTDEDKDIYMRVDAVNGGGTSYDFEVKVSAAETYSAVTVLTPGVWARLKDQDGEPIGEIAEQVMAYIPTGATLAVGDEFVIPQNRTRWTQSLGTERPISSVNTIFTLGGEEIRVPGGWQVAAAWQSLTSNPDTAGRQGNDVERSGDFIVTLTPTRRIIDLVIQYGLHQGQTFGCYVDAKTDAKIGASTRRYRFLMGFPAVRAFGPMFGVQPGGQNRDEAPRLVAGVPASSGTYDSLSFASHFGIYVENDVASL